MDLGQLIIIWIAYGNIKYHLMEISGRDAHNTFDIDRWNKGLLGEAH